MSPENAKGIGGIELRTISANLKNVDFTFDVIIFTKIWYSLTNEKIKTSGNQMVLFLASLEERPKAEKIRLYLSMKL